MWNRLFLNKNILLLLSVLSFCGFCEAQCPTDFNDGFTQCCYNYDWGTISVGLSAIKPGGLNSLPIAVKSHHVDDEGWEGKLYTLRFDWHPAWEVDITKNLCGGGVLGLQYWGTHLNDSFSVSDPDGKLFLIFSGGENNGTDLTRVKARTKLDVAKIAFNYTDLLTCGCHARIDWYAGLTFYYFDSVVLAKGFYDDTLELFTKNDDTNYLIGPTTGIFYNYYCNDCFCLYLNTNLSVCYNSHKIKRIEGPIDTVDAPMDFHYRFGTVLPVIESALGVTFSWCKWNVDVEYGFKWFYHLFDSAQQLDDTNDAAGVSTPYDVSFHGVTIRVGRAF